MAKRDFLDGLGNGIGWLLAGALGLAAAAANIKPNEDPQLWVVVVAALSALSLLLGLWKVLPTLLNGGATVVAWARNRPRLKLSAVRAQVNIYEQVGSTTTTRSGDFVFAQVENLSSRPVSDALSVQAFLTFQDEAGKHWDRMPGRWRSSPDVRQTGSPTAITDRVTIPAGRRDQLDIAFKYPHEAVAYALNTEISASPDWKDRPLPEGRNRVHIEVWSSNAPTVRGDFELEVRQVGDGHTLYLRPLSRFLFWTAAGGWMPFKQEPQRPTVTASVSPSTSTSGPSSPPQPRVAASSNTPGRSHDETEELSVRDLPPGLMASFYQQEAAIDDLVNRDEEALDGSLVNVEADDGDSQVPAVPLDPEIRLDPDSHAELIAITVKNDGAPGRFKAEVLGITSERWHAGAEPSDWPWPIRWGTTDEETNVIQPSASSVLHLVQFDHAGAQSQLASQGGAAFHFLGPKSKRYHVRGALGLSSIDELRKVELKVTIRVRRLDSDSERGPFVERTLCLTYLGTASWCD